MNILDGILELEELLTQLNYKSKEPFKEGAKVLIWVNKTFISATFVKYTPCDSDNYVECRTCFKYMEFKDIIPPYHEVLPHISRCNTATAHNSHRRVFLADDPIVDVIKIHFNY
jgi:hypothetical protein